jgi:ABC-type sugar transport system ATPase subunit
MKLNINHMGAVEICVLIQRRLKYIEETILFDSDVAHLYKPEVDRLTDILNQLQSNFNIVL